MPEKRNNIRDILGDYRTTGKLGNGFEEDEKRRFLNRREKRMILTLIVLFLVLIAKSIALDEVKHLSADQQQFKDYVEYTVEKEASATLNHPNLMVYRVYDIYTADSTEKGLLKYEDPKTGKMVEVIQKERYIGMVRGYLLWIFPITHFTVTSEIVE